MLYILKPTKALTMIVGKQLSPSAFCFADKTQILHYELLWALCRI